jgi:PilX N-terminal
MQQRGIALVITLITLAVFSALGLGLLLATAAERLIGANHSDAVHAINAAEAGLELAARELALTADWSRVLAGLQQSRLIDGPPSGLRAAGTVDLTALTNQITCDSSAACSDPRVRASTRDRPWGPNNPRWQPFLYGTLSRLTAVPLVTPDTYIVVWIGDDARERDGNVGVDDGLASGDGLEVVRAHAEAFSPGGTRRVVEADLIRPCQTAGGVRTCGPGIRVQSWRVRTGGIP